MCLAQGPQLSAKLPNAPTCWTLPCSVPDGSDVQGRINILGMHSRGKTLVSDVDFEQIDRRTPGFSGADPQNLRHTNVEFV
jgi:hypothetical protein